MPLKVIGAGMGRAGTYSLKLALDRLGFGPCCHMFESLKPENRWRFPLWERAFDDEPVDWEEVFAGFNSAVDAPTNYYYRELARAYPDAKIVLTVRDPDKWFESVDAIFGPNGVAPDGRPRGSQPNPIAEIAEKVSAAQTKRGFRPAGGYPDDLEERRRVVIAHFNHWNEEVQRSFPPGRVLAFNVKEGWEPLCRFLGAPVPEAPFPRENTREDLTRRVQQSRPEPSGS